MKNNIFRILSLAMICLVAIAFSYITLGMDEKLQNTTNNALPVPSSKIINPQSNTLSNNTSSPVIAKKPSLSNIAQSSLTDGLVAYYPFNGNANDESGNGNNGTVTNGAVLNTDRFGKPDSAYSFDGVDDYIDVGPGFDLDAFTLDAWVFIDPATNIGERRVISKDNNNLSGDRKIFALKTSSPYVSGKHGNPAFGTAIAPFHGIHMGDPHLDAIEAPSALTAGWHHLAGVRDTAAMRLELYVDSVLVASKTPSVFGPINSQVNTVIGQVSPAYPYEFFSGLIDEVRIYNRALSESEIRELYLFNESAYEICNNGIDDDNNGLADCEDPQCCSNDDCVGNSDTCKKLVETISSQKATMNDAGVTGDLTGTLDFNSFEMVNITTGSFAGKGFSKGECETTLEGITYKGEWKGVAFFNQKENRIDIKGAITGEILATVEGSLTESVEGSGVYDHYQATWKIGRLSSSITSAIINIDGYLSYQTRSEYLNTKLYFLQDNFKGTVGGDYTGDLNTVLTHLRIVSKDNPYTGEGFSIISYNHASGAGQGWTYDKLVDQGIVDSRGLFTNPLYGVAYNVLNETQPRLYTTSIMRIDQGLPPAPDLKVKTWGPRTVSPGQTIDYIIEYRNDGTKPADDVILINTIDTPIKFVSASRGAEYDDFFNEVNWQLGKVSAQSKGNLYIRVAIPWGQVQGGLQGHDKLGISSHILNIEASTLLLAEEKRNQALCGEDRDLFVNGVNLQLGNARAKSYQAFAKCLTEHGTLGVWVPAYYTGCPTIPLPKCGMDSDSLQVNRATPSFITTTKDHIEATDYNGLKDPSITDCTYRAAYAHSGGTRTLVTAIRLYNLRVKKLVLMSPISGVQYESGQQDDNHNVYKKEILELFDKYGVQELEIYQSPNDIIPPGNLPGLPNIQFKFDPNDPLWKGRNIKIHEIKFPTLKQNFNGGIEGHSRLFDAAVADICGQVKNNVGDVEGVSFFITELTTANDPNAKYGHRGPVSAGQKLDYKVEFENVGEGIAFGVYFTDTLDEDLDDATLEIGPVKDVKDDSVIGQPGVYDPKTRTITWLAGEVGPSNGGYANLSVNVKSDAPKGTEIINYATVYFPSVPEVTPTNPIVSWIPVEDCGNGIDDDGDGLVDCDDPDCSGNACQEVCDDGKDNDGDGFVDCADTDCPPCQEICNNGLDDDRDGLIDCADPECAGDAACCDSTNFSKGLSSVRFNHKKASKDTARMSICVDETFCDLLSAGIEEMSLRLNGCGEITIPGTSLKANKKKTVFKATSANYNLLINCKKHTLKLTLKKMELKGCVDNPVKFCVAIKDGPCLCAEGTFTEKRDKAGNLRLLKLLSTNVCP